MEVTTKVLRLLIKMVMTGLLIDNDDNDCKY